jgi:hypothetical protein
VECTHGRHRLPTADEGEESGDDGRHGDQSVVALPRWWRPPVTRPTPVLIVKELLAVLRERHGLDRDTVAAMAFERSRQQKVTLTQAFTDLVAELDRVAASTAAPRVFRNAKDVADAAVESRRRQPRPRETK